MIVEAVWDNPQILRHYVLHAFVVMPNHVHLLVTAAVPVPKLTKSLKGITAKRANAMLALTGRPFWREESYDHVVRHEREFQTIRSYIEQNPVRAGLACQPGDSRWSSAGWATGGSPADQGIGVKINRQRGKHLFTQSSSRIPSCYVPSHQPEALLRFADLAPVMV